jgi:uncharacterized protein
MTNRDEIIALLKRAKPSFQARFSLGDIGLFGSYARGDQTEQSDIDILVDVKGTIGFEFMQLADDLEQMLGKKVDLITKNSLRKQSYDYIAKDIIYV